MEPTISVTDVVRKRAGTSGVRLGVRPGVRPGGRPGVRPQQTTTTQRITIPRLISLQGLTPSLTPKTPPQNAGRWTVRAILSPTQLSPLPSRSDGDTAMRMGIRSLLIVSGAGLFLQASAGAQTQPAGAGTKQFTSADLKAWKGIRQTALSPDGKWFAYVLAPNEGDATVIIRATQDGGKEM